jgi:hypothetical protein
MMADLNKDSSSTEMMADLNKDSSSTEMMADLNKDSSSTEMMADLNKDRVMVYNATLNNISVMLWRSVLLVEESEYLEKTTDLPQITDKLHHIICKSLTNFIA